MTLHYTHAHIHSLPSPHTLSYTGGRNVTISLQSRTGHMSMRTAVGLLVFSQFWFWYPLCHFLSLAFTPTAAIALNSELKVGRLLNSLHYWIIASFPGHLEGMSLIVYPHSQATSNVA